MLDDLNYSGKFDLNRPCVKIFIKFLLLNFISINYIRIIMKRIQNYSQSIGGRYPTTTGRLKRVIGGEQARPKKVALLGDSTLDNGYWVQSKSQYADKTHTVTHQTAVALANNTENTHSYDIGNFAVDGATTADLRRQCRLDKVLPSDQDHPYETVHQLNAVKDWQPDIAVLSVGGNNYREALMGVLQRNLTYFQLLFRITPEQARPRIKEAFSQVKLTLLKEYKAIIDDLVNDNPGLNRIVLLSQYYPSITDFTPYFIYTGFSHLARSKGEGQAPFAVVEETMNELYRSVLQYAVNQNKEVVFVDVTSSLNPLGGNHTSQIEPNEQGSIIMGKLIAEAVEYNFPINGAAVDKKPISMLRMNRDEVIQAEVLDDENIQNFEVKKIGSFISENRYRHVGLFFSPSSSLGARYVHGYELVMGKQFDTEFTGLFAFGLLDLSLVTVMASYLWRVAVNDTMHISLRVTTGIIAAPILLSKLVVGLAVMLALALPIYGYHSIVNYFSGNAAEREEAANTEHVVPTI
ncbi:SGNH/GDSL hydrolase family protein [Legionella moravica]|nr:SGNH/GDSL hydrolase family protein [Legionella moravica]